MKSSADVDEYIAKFSHEQQKVLKRMRSTIAAVVPDAEEKLGYGIPTFKLNGKNLVHFAAFRDHYSLFPGGQAVAELADELTDFKTSKGTIQFPADRPVPLELVTRVVEHCVAQRSK